jgi:hypothetical protein
LYRIPVWPSEFSGREIAESSGGASASWNEDTLCAKDMMKPRVVGKKVVHEGDGGLNAVISNSN